jgi:hypothetical protein
MRHDYPTLKDMRHIGPESEKNISGVCSACGVTLLAWLEESDPCGPALVNRIQELFKLHVAEYHPHPPRLRVNQPAA